MAKGFNISFDDKQLRSILNDLKDTVDEKTAEIDAEIAAHGELMATSAKNLAPVDSGRMRASISLKKEQFLSYNLVAQTNYAAYLEFGTGQYAASYVPSLDEEWQALAKQFYKNGQGRIPARPFMVPSIEAYTPPLVKRIKDILND